MVAYNESEGMTDMQFKTYLLDQLENWQRVHDLAVVSKSADIQAEAEKQINKFNMALTF